MQRPFTLHINGQPHSAFREPCAQLARVLRDELNLTGTHIGCDTSQCGVCTVLIESRAVASLEIGGDLPAPENDRRQISTVAAVRAMGTAYERAGA